MRLEEGKRLPWWAGVAWQDVIRDECVVLPLGLNLIVGGLRRLWMASRTPRWIRTYVDREVVAAVKNASSVIARQEFDRGYRVGYEKGQQYLRSEIQGHFRRLVKEAHKEQPS